MSANSRIAIVGGPGSGKTTLAYKLARHTGATVVELDSVAYPAGNAPLPTESRRFEAEQIANTSHWVAEGIYLGWTDPLFEAAEYVIWMDTGWPTAMGRIVKRHIISTLRGTNQHRGWRKLLRFLRSSHRYYTESIDDRRDMFADLNLKRRTTERTLAESWSSKLVRLQSAREVDEWLHTVFDRN